MPPLTLQRLALLFFRTGTFVFGGGQPTMAALYTEVVGARRWLPPERFGLVFALARITPGTNLLAFCAGLGWELLGWPGALAGVLAVGVPSSIIAVILTEGYEAWKSNAVAMAAIAGILASGVGMMAAGAWQIVGPNMNRRRAARALVLAIGAFILSGTLGLAPVQVLALAALAGVVWRSPVEP
jgi:chromate transporter